MTNLLFEISFCDLGNVWEQVGTTEAVKGALGDATHFLCSYSNNPRRNFVSLMLVRCLRCIYLSLIMLSNPC